MPSVTGICTESVACVPPVSVAALGIEVVPLPVHFGADTYHDGVDLDADAFYARMATDPVLPTTSGASPGEYLEAIDRLAARGHREVVVVTLSSRLSSSLSSARVAASSAPLPVRVVDSGIAAAPQGLLARAAARFAEVGGTSDAVVDLIERLKPHAGLLAVIPTLEYLRRGGRIGRLAGFAGERLAIKPLVTLRNGEVRANGVVRSLEHAYARMVDHLRTVSSAAACTEVAVMQADAAEPAGVLSARIAEAVSPGALDTVAFTPVMGAHTGPGVIGVGWLAHPAGERRGLPESGR